MLAGRVWAWQLRPRVVAGQPAKNRRRERPRRGGLRRGGWYQLPFLQVPFIYSMWDLLSNTILVYMCLI
ncbi:hypothetical protein BRARA_B01113 [Brassica rapa]|uniref:Uncharacterized protein n=1 Tax=Brassica campestris TaxID=3711 RepID=A0A398ABJ0_BRACM|nr:hypothetical protein BRARA_B01113 [Brassica rapa]